MKKRIVKESKTKTKAEPFVRWAGGKKQLLGVYSKLFPDPNSYNRHIEPFVGGGAVFFHLQERTKKKAIIADLNCDLINSYKAIKSNIERLLVFLRRHEEKHSKKYYYELRREFNSREKRDSVERAAIFIYLNKASFNGLHRVNSRGEFNVPLGRRNGGMLFDKQNLRLVSQMLRGVTLKAGSYDEILKKAGRKDFIYLDPPYFPIEQKNKFSAPSFTSYTAIPFLREEHIKLAAIAKKLQEKGCKVMISNSDTQFVRGLYPRDQFKVVPVNAKRYINCIGKKRNNARELVIMSK